MATKSDKLISSWISRFSSKCTVINYQSDIKSFANWLGKKSILEAGERDIRNYLLDLEEKDHE